MTDSIRKVAIIGSGPAGLTAALYTARANLKPLVIEGLDAGGQLMLTTAVENFPGFTDGIMGPELMAAMRAQAERFGAEFLRGNVTNVKLHGPPFHITTSDETIAARTSSSPPAPRPSCSACRRAPLDGPWRLDVRDLRRFLLPRQAHRRRRRRRLGDGGSHLPDALRLARHGRAPARHAARVKIMQDKALAHPKISFEWNTEVVDVKDVSVGEVTGLHLRNLQSGAEKDLPVDGVFVAIGHVPNTSLFSGQLESDAAGYLIAREGAKTSIPGVFACGDVQDHVYRQAITAAGSGCMAAIDAERYLEHQGH